VSNQLVAVQVVTIIRPDGSRRNSSTLYQDFIVVQRDDGTTAVFRANSWTDVNGTRFRGVPFESEIEGISEGSYPGTYGAAAHKGTMAGININNRGEVATIGPNRLHNGRAIANGVNIHKGFKSLRGSQGCVTVHPDDADEFFAMFTEGEKLVVRISSDIVGPRRPSVRPERSRISLDLGELVRSFVARGGY
jgi:hypothetical protein